MGVPESAFEEADPWEVKNSRWYIRGYIMSPGARVMAYDDRSQGWSLASIVSFTENSITITFSDGFRFIFSAERCAIKLLEEEIPVEAEEEDGPLIENVDPRQLSKMPIPEQLLGMLSPEERKRVPNPVIPSPSESGDDMTDSEAAAYWRGQAEVYRDMVEFLHILVNNSILKND